MTLSVVCATLLACVQPLIGQDTGNEILAAARKRASEARGQEGPARVAVFEDALRILDLVVERHPDDAAACSRAHLERGRILRRLERTSAAEHALRQVLESASEERPAADALHELASLYRKAKRNEEALAALLEVVEKHPAAGMPRARALIRAAGLKRDRLKDPEGAIQLLRQTLREYGDLWRQSVDALDALVTLVARTEGADAARQVLTSHREALTTRFAETRHAERVARALEAMRCHRAVESAAAEEADGDTGA
jgi:tetratricopeptide (TPR) repeat protein